MKSDSTIIQNNQFNNYQTIIPGFIKVVILVVLSCLTLQEVFQFIILRGLENPIAYCLFKIIAYSTSLIFVKFSDCSMVYLLNNLKAVNEQMIFKLDEIANYHLQQEKNVKNQEEKHS